MQLLQVLTSYTLGLFALSLPVTAQTFVYSGREYLNAGRSWSQIREMNLSTGRRVQLTATPRDHSGRWCAPDGRSILFTPSPLGGDKLLFRFDRITKKETPLITLEQDLFRIVDSLDPSNIVVEEYGGVIEVIDLAKRRKVRRIGGLNPVLASNRKMIAWETPVDIISHPEQHSHVLLSDIDSHDQVDLGEGAAPVFLPDEVTLLFARVDDTNHKLQVVRYNTRSKIQEAQATRRPEFITEVYDFTVSPDGTTKVLSTDGGGHGSAVYWRMISNKEWNPIDENLGRWGGWSRNGCLIYSTDGRDLRQLDAKRTVWGSDIKIFDQQTGRTRTVLSGTSMNLEPSWCADVPK